MQPLIDGDILLYEAGFAAETGWESEDSPPFSYVEEILENKVGNICAMAGATLPPIFFFTGKTNFRNTVAKSFNYKNRPGNKPFHYYNIKAYIKGKYEWRQQEGLEADDLMAIFQCEREELYKITCCSEHPSARTIICSRDKDLRAVPGWHYGWEVGNQPSFGPAIVTEFGAIRLSSDRKSLKGEGLLFFYSQCLLGDRVDTIPGLPGTGPVKAFELLSPCQNETEACRVVLEAYRGTYGEGAEEMLLEQGRCLWMTRGLLEDGQPKLWEIPSLSSEATLQEGMEQEQQSKP
jgi:hypothetical protein